MGNRLNVSHGAPQNQASFIVDQGWKSSNSSPLPVEGEVFFLTFPFIDQAFALIDPVSAKAIYRQLSRNFAPNKAHVSNRSACDDGQSQVQTVRPGQSGRQSSVRSNCHTRRIGECIVFRIRQVVGGVEAAQRESWFRLRSRYIAFLLPDS